MTSESAWLKRFYEKIRRYGQISKRQAKAWTCQRFVRHMKEQREQNPGKKAALYFDLRNATDLSKRRLAGNALIAV